jgi:hypothetical protein
MHAQVSPVHHGTAHYCPRLPQRLRARTRTRGLRASAGARHPQVSSGRLWDMHVTIDSQDQLGRCNGAHGAVNHACLGLRGVLHAVKWVIQGIRTGYSGHSAPLLNQPRCPPLPGKQAATSRHQAERCDRAAMQRKHSASRRSFRRTRRSRKRGTTRVGAIGKKGGDGVLSGGVMCGYMRFCAPRRA